MNLTDHFTLEELTRSQTAVDLGLDNTPSPEVVASLTLTAQYLERIRARVRAEHGEDKVISVTSGYRSPAVNQAVRSKPTSYHVLGLAADIRVPGIEVLDLARFIEARFQDYDQLIFEFRSWVHVGLPRPGQKPRVERLTIDADGVRLGLLP